MGKVKTIIVTTVALTVICVVATVALALTNQLTSKKIAEVALNAEKEAMNRVISAAQFKKGTVAVGDDIVYYDAYDNDGNLIGNIFTTSAHGYGGEVKVMTGIGTDGKIIAIEVLSVDDETPGLGQNAGKSSFWEAFKGKSGTIAIVKGEPKDGEIKALTGATITSNAVRDAVNKALDARELIIGEAEN